MSEDDGHENDSGADRSIITARLRACEGCKARKVRCDRLSPCSACRSSNIPCWTVPRSTAQQKRQRAVVSTRYQEQLSRVNAQLAQLRLSLENLAKQNVQIQTPYPAVVLDPINKHRAKTPKTSSPNAMPYLGESSFEVHSQQTGQILDKALNNSPTAGLDVTSSLQSLATLQSRACGGNDENSFTTDLSMPPVQVALAALRLMETSELGFSMCSPFMDGAWFRDICQRVYFPVNGFSESDFIIANGGLYGIISMATDLQLRQFRITPEIADQTIALCSNNVSVTVVKMSVFTAPTFANIEALLFGVQIAMAESDHTQAWCLISFAARLCMDSGLNHLKDSTGKDEPEIERKKMVFWFIYAFDRGMCLSFGRSPNFSDFDISTGYPQVKPASLQPVIAVWFDLAKIQGRTFEKLYSAQGLEASPEVKERDVRELASELVACREELQSMYHQLSEEEMAYFLDTEVTVIVTLTIVYRVLPSQKPAHPLRFSDECIATARETLQLHEALCSMFMSKTDNQMRIYIDWNLSFCPFTPFIVILGTAILDTSAEDMNLLDRVVESLEQASVKAPGAKKILGICKILLRGGKACVEQSLSTGIGPPTLPQAFPARPQPAIASTISAPAPDTFMLGTMDSENSWAAVPEDWTSLQLDNPDDMSLLFDSYLAGTSGMPFFDPDISRFDTT